MRLVWTTIVEARKRSRSQHGSLSNAAWVRARPFEIAIEFD